MGRNPSLFRGEEYSDKDYIVINREGHNVRHHVETIKWQGLMLIDREGHNIRHPVETVTWFDALGYLNKLSALKGLKPAYELTNIVRDNDGRIKKADVTLTASTIYETEGYRLPTEAEEESLIRAGTNTRFRLGPISMTQVHMNHLLTANSMSMFGI